MVEGGGLENRLAVQVTGVRIPLPPPFKNLTMFKAAYNNLECKRIPGCFCLFLSSKIH